MGAAEHKVKEVYCDLLRNYSELLEDFLLLELHIC